MDIAFNPHTTPIQKQKDQTNQYHIQLQESKKRWENHVANTFRMTQTLKETPVLLWNNIVLFWGKLVNYGFAAREYSDTTKTEEEYVGSLLLELKNNQGSYNKAEDQETIELWFETNKFIQNLEDDNVYSFWKYTIQKTSKGTQWMIIEVVDTNANKHRMIELDTTQGQSIDNNADKLNVKTVIETISLDTSLHVDYALLKPWDNSTKIINIDSLKNIHDIGPKNSFRANFTNIELFEDWKNGEIFLSEDSKFLCSYHQSRATNRDGLITKMEHDFIWINIQNFAHAMKVLGCHEKDIENIANILSKKNSNNFNIHVTKNAAWNFVIYTMKNNVPDLEKVYVTRHSNILKTKEEYIAALLFEMKTNKRNDSGYFADGKYFSNIAKLWFEVSQFIQSLEYDNVYSYWQYTIQKFWRRKDWVETKSFYIEIVDTSSNKNRSISLQEGVLLTSTRSEIDWSDVESDSIVLDDNIDNGVFWFSLQTVWETIALDTNLEIDYSSLKIWDDITDIIDINSLKVTHDINEQNVFWAKFKNVNVRWDYNPVWLHQASVDISENKIFNSGNKCTLSNINGIITGVEFSFVDINQHNFANAMKILWCKEEDIKNVNSILKKRNLELYYIVASKDDSWKFTITIYDDNREEKVYTTK